MLKAKEKWAFYLSLMLFRIFARKFVSDELEIFYSKKNLS